MTVTYLKLWHRLLDLGMTKTGLRTAAGISTGTLAKLSKGEEVTMDTLVRICKVIKCDIGDIVSYMPEKEDNGHENAAINDAVGNCNSDNHRAAVNG